MRGPPATLLRCSPARHLWASTASLAPLAMHAAGIARNVQRCTCGVYTCARGGDSRCKCVPLQMPDCRICGHRQQCWICRGETSAPSHGRSTDITAIRPRIAEVRRQRTPAYRPYACLPTANRNFQSCARHAVTARASASAARCRGPWTLAPCRTAAGRLHGARIA